LGLRGKAVEEFAGPVGLAGIQGKLQVGAGFGIHLPPYDHESGTHLFRRVAKAEPGGERDALGVADFEIGKIHGDNPEPAGLYEEIGSFESVFGIASAPHPEQLRQRNSRSFGGSGIKRSGRIDEGAIFLPERRLGEQRNQQRHPAGGGRPVDFRHPRPRNSAGKRIYRVQTRFHHLHSRFLVKRKIHIEAVD
jgi:hypothetical protein